MRNEFNDIPLINADGILQQMNGTGLYTANTP